MNTSKLLKKLEKFFDMPAQAQQRKHHKLEKIIAKLEAKQEALQAELIEVGKEDDTSKRFQALTTELKVVSKLIKKAKKHDRLL